MKHALISVALCVGALACSGNKPVAQSQAPATASRAVEPAPEPTTTEPEEAEPAASDDHAALLEALALVPDGADLLIGADAGTLASSPMAHALFEEMAGEELFDFLEVTRTCNVPPNTWRFAVVGSSTRSPNTSVAFVSATGLATETTLKCLVEASETHAPELGLTIAEDDRGLALRGANDQLVLALSEDVLAVLDAAARPALEESLAGRGRSAIEGSMRGPMSLTNTSRPLFFAFRNEDPQASGMTFESVTGGLDIAPDLEAEVLLHFLDGAEAERNAQTIRKQFTELRGMAGMFGIPREALDSVQIDSQGRSARVRGRLTVAQFRQILTSFRTQASGAPAAPRN